MNSCQSLEVAVRAASAEIGANSRKCRTSSGGRIVRGSATGAIFIKCEAAADVADVLPSWTAHVIDDALGASGDNALV